MLPHWLYPEPDDSPEGVFAGEAILRVLAIRCKDETQARDMLRGCVGNVAEWHRAGLFESCFAQLRHYRQLFASGSDREIFDASIGIAFRQQAESISSAHWLANAVAAKYKLCEEDRSLVETRLSASVGHPKDAAILRDFETTLDDVTGMQGGLGSCGFLAEELLEAALTFPHENRFALHRLMGANGLKAFKRVTDPPLMDSIWELLVERFHEFKRRPPTRFY